MQYYAREHMDNWDFWVRMSEQVANPDPGTGISAMQTGPYAAMMVMNGEDAVGCDLACSEGAPEPGGAFIQSGGIWLRTFE